MRRMQKFQVLSKVYTTFILISLVTACEFKTDSELSVNYRPTESSSADCPDFDKSVNGRYAVVRKNCDQSCRQWNSCWRCDQEKIIERQVNSEPGSRYRYDGCDSKRESRDDWLQCFCKPMVHADCADWRKCCDAKDNSINDDSDKCRILGMDPSEACRKAWSPQCFK